MPVPYDSLRFQDQSVQKRKANRLTDYDYSRSGYYFVTICTKDRGPWFGEIRDGEMALNQCGESARVRWLEIPTHFKSVQLDAYIVMPNHIHGIIIINGDDHDDNNVRNRHACSLPQNKNRQYQKLPVIIGSYKAAVAKSIHQIMPDQDFRWQKSFYDHIIRNDASLNQVREYIMNNPLNWANDVENQ